MNETMPADDTKLIQRDTPEPNASRAAYVKQWQDSVVQAKAHWKPDFDRMRDNMKFANGKQWPGQTANDQRYIANLVQRVIKTTVAALYAKNPTVVAQRRKTLDFRIWDGRPESAMQAQQTMMTAQSALMAAQAGVPLPPEAALAIPDPNAMMQAQALLADIQQGANKRQVLDKLGKTLVCLMDYYMNEAQSGFKLQMKQMIRRARTTGVGYVRLNFQRAMELSEAQTSQIADFSERLATIGRLQADLADGVSDPYCAEAEELRLSVAAVQSEPEVIVREGIVWGFPHSTRLIPSISTEKLMGWVGSDWVAEEIMLTSDRVKEVYGVDVGDKFTAYRQTQADYGVRDDRRVKDRSKGLVCAWNIFDKSTGMEMTIAEGYPEFLKEPASPSVFIEQFFPWFAVTFNDAESEGEIFPKSDVELLKSIQREYNRAKEALRQHRIANRPLYLVPNGALEEDEVKSLESYPAHAVIALNGLEKGQKASDVLMPVQKIGIDPNVYETQTLFEDMARVTGNQEAILGGNSNGTATESNIAESSRQGSLGLDSDDLDEMLSSLFRAASQVMLTELDEATVKDIVGIGAIWPSLSRLEVMRELWLSVKGGSSGRPDAARDAATFERLYPLLLQIPGLSPRWLGERAVRIADDDTDIEDAIVDGLPSIMSQNRMAQIGTGDSSTNPNEQGGEGGNKERPGRPDGQDSSSFPGAGANGAMQ